MSDKIDGGNDGQTVHLRMRTLLSRAASAVRTPRLYERRDGSAFPFPGGDWRIWLAMLLPPICAIAATFGAMLCGFKAYDNDQWFILSTGREIAEHGIPRTNPFAVYEGMSMVCQQWLVALSEYVVFAAFGQAGISAYVTAWACAMALLIYAAGREFSDGSRTAGCVASAVGMLLLSHTGYINVRPECTSVCVMLCVMICCRRYERDGAVRHLAALPLLAMAQSNMQSSMLPGSAFIVMAYFALGAPAGDPGRWRARLAMALAASGVAACVNPYGWRAALYFFLAYPSTRNATITEMHTFMYVLQHYPQLGGNKVPIFVGAFLCGIVPSSVVISSMYGMLRNGTEMSPERRRMIAPLVMFVVGAMMSAQHYRNIFIIPTFAMPMLACLCGTVSRRLWSLPRHAPDAAGYAWSRRCALALSATLSVFLLVTRGFGIPVSYETIGADRQNVPVRAVEWLDANVPRGTAIGCGYNAGGFLEWHGYKVPIDPSAERWTDELSGGGDRYATYQDAGPFLTYNGSSDRVGKSGEWLTESGCRYTIANDSSNLARWLASYGAQGGWRTVMSGNGYSLWTNVSEAE